MSLVVIFSADPLSSAMPSSLRYLEDDSKGGGGGDWRGKRKKLAEVPSKT